MGKLEEKQNELSDERADGTKASEKTVTGKKIVENGKSKTKIVKLK